MNTEQLLHEIYEKEITRNINPAVAANKMDAETINTEIGEYIFSDDIINALYKVLNTIKGDGTTDKKGIWINGYYGSGKSHFLKYVHYCMNPDTSEKAFNHLYEELDKKDIFDTNTHLEYNKTDFTTIQRWFSKADVDDILFNVQTFSNTENKGRGTFTNVFFNMFNKRRGLNGSNIRLAVFLESKLQSEGKLQLFIDKIEEEGFNWEVDYSMLSHTELDTTVLRIAKECDPTIDVESLKNALIGEDAVQITIDFFAKELKKYLDKRDDNARIVFLVDEVSQFINNNKDVLLDLQDLVEHVSNTCGDKVIIACTAQQTMDEMVDGTGVSSINKLDEIGKIMGRFETRVSLQSTDPSYITKKRILAKKGMYDAELRKFYNDNKESIQAQFFTDNQQYRGYDSEDDFTSCYPFVPYQFELISKVFEGFQSKDYVQKEVKDNERSILKITHVTAKLKKDKHLGYFVPFDAFYNNMMEENFIHKGHRAIEPALKLTWSSEEEKSFALRVIHVLFMISNLNESNRQQLESNIDNITWLLIDSLENNRKELKEKITKVIETLRDENVIREEKGDYYFYNEDEAELSSIIKNTMSRDIEFELETFNKEILSKVIPKLSSKYNTALRSFSILVSIDGKIIVNVANPDLKVKFTLFDTTEINTITLENEKNCLVICIHEKLNNNKRLREEYIQYCKVMNYIRLNQNITNKVRENSIANFRERYRLLMKQTLFPSFKDLINSASIIKSTEIIEHSHFSGKTGKDRYDVALRELIDLNYNKLSLIEDYPQTADALNKYLNKPTELLDILSDAEQVVESIIKIRGNQIVLAELISILDKAPYGWPNIPLLGVLVDLHKHKRRSFNYNHEKRYSVENFINKAQNKRELQSLEIVAMQQIDQAVINQLRKDWEAIFNTPIASEKDGDDLFNELSGRLLDEQINKYQEGRNRASKYVFVNTFDDLISEIRAIKQISDPKLMYKQIHLQVDNLTEKVNQCNSLIGMMGRKRFMEEYNAIINFVKTKKQDVEHLEGDYTEQWSFLEKFINDKNPNTELKSASKIYKDLLNELETAVSNNKASLIKNYTLMYDEINNIAETNNILKEEYTPLSKYVNEIQNCHDVSQLKMYALSLDAKKDELRGFILDLVAKKNTETSHAQTPIIDGGETKTSSKATKTDSTKINKQKTQHYKIKKPDIILKTVDDVDAYLKQIREDIKRLIDDNNSVIVD